jgi:hypothetical protein
VLIGFFFLDTFLRSVDAGIWNDTASAVVRTAYDWDAVENAPWGHKLTALTWWVILNLIAVAISAYAIYWFLGATTSTYADLRADVDGTEEDEIYLEEEEEDFEALAKTEPVTTGETPPPAAPAPGAPEPGTSPPPPPSYDPTKPGA